MPIHTRDLIVKSENNTLAECFAIYFVSLLSIR